MSATAYLTAAVTPADGTNLTNGMATCLFIGVGGDVAIWSPSTSTSVVHKNAASGTVLLVQAIRVLATGTTATNIVAWYA